MADGGTGGLLGTTWITSGPGLVTPGVGYLSISSNNTVYTSAAQEVTVIPGRLYRFSYTGETNTFMRKVGSVQEGDQYLAQAPGILGLNAHTFTPTTNKVWVQFQRLSANTAVANDLRLHDLQTPDLAARSLNGTNQFFYQSNLLYGFHSRNANFFIGGWWKLNVVPTTGAPYFYDFGTLDAGTAGGTGRVRLVFDAANNRLVASNMDNAPGGYREHYLENPGFTVNTPVFLGLAVKADGDPYPVIGTRRGGGTFSGGMPTINNSLFQQMRIGTTARTTAPAGSYVNGSVWDVFWHVGSIPSDAVLNAIASGQRPAAIAGWEPTYLWPMGALSATMDEESIAQPSTLRQIGSPGVVAPPAPPPPPDPVSETLPFFII